MYKRVARDAIGKRRVGAWLYSIFRVLWLAGTTLASQLSVKRRKTVKVVAADGDSGRSITARDAPAEEASPRRLCTFDGFVEDMSRAAGVRLASLEALTTLRVRTNRSTYRIMVLDPSEGKILIQGGKYFVEPVEACLNGSSLGGSSLKIDWVGQRMRMEISHGGRPIVTSPVHSIEILNNVSSDLPSE